jgi:hypothetical protein
MRPIDELASGDPHPRRPHQRGEPSLAGSHRRIRSAKWLVRQRHAVLRALAELECGIAMGAAREKVRVARALENLPKVSAAMASGRLSYSKAREITRIACAATEDHLLMIAEHGTARHVENLVRAYRRCQEAEELSREAPQQQSRECDLATRRRWLDRPDLPATRRKPARRILKAIDVAMENVPAGTSRNLFGSAHVARTPSPWWPKVSLLTPPSNAPAPIAIRSWCTSRPKPCEIGRRAAASSNTALRWPRRRRAGCPATRAWSL